MEDREQGVDSNSPTFLATPAIRERIEALQLARSSRTAPSQRTEAQRLNALVSTKGTEETI